MILYNKIYEILNQKYIPSISNNNLQEICCYRFYKNNNYFHKNKEIDLHKIIGVYVTEIMDAIYDYCMNNYIQKINIITGNGNVLKPKVKKYLEFYNMRYMMKNKGNFYINIY